MPSHWSLKLRNSQQGVCGIQRYTHSVHLQSCYSQFALPKHGTSRTSCIVPHSILIIQNPRVGAYKARELVQSLLGENRMSV